MTKAKNRRTERWGASGEAIAFEGTRAVAGRPVSAPERVADRILSGGLAAFVESARDVLDLGVPKGKTCNAEAIARGLEVAIFGSDELEVAGYRADSLGDLAARPVNQARVLAHLDALAALLGEEPEAEEARLRLAAAGIDVIALDPVAVEEARLAAEEPSPKRGRSTVAAVRLAQALAGLWLREVGPLGRHDRVEGRNPFREFVQLVFDAVGVEDAHGKRIDGVWHARQAAGELGGERNP